MGFGDSKGEAGGCWLSSGRSWRFAKTWPQQKAWRKQQQLGRQQETQMT